MRRAAVVVIALVLGACEDTVPAWELDNDRIIAVRSTPPHVPAGGTATIDALVTAMGSGGPAVATPSAAAVVPSAPDQAVPAALANAVTDDGGVWTLHAPDAATLDAVRAELGVMPGVPVAIRIGVTIGFAAGPLAAIKVVTLGDSGDNPTLGAITVNGMTPTDGMTVPADTDVALHADAVETDEVDWLTSVGDLKDEDDPDAVLNHDTTADPPRPTAGHLAVVKRDATGGVTWGFWTIAVGGP